MKVRDKMWMFGCRPHDDDKFLGKRTENIEHEWSRITPAEGALMLGIPNVLMVNCDGVPVPYSDEAFGYMESFCRMQNVLWSAVGSAGFRVGNEEKYIRDMAEKYPNLRGAMLDDFFMKYPGDPDREEKLRKDLAEIRSVLDEACRPMEIWITWYTHEFNSCAEKMLEMVDGITLWTWKQEDLVNLKENFERTEKLFGGKKILLGVYMFDYPSGKVLSDETMEMQCEYGLSLMKEGRIDGMIYCDNCVMGVGLSSEYWLRNWIDRVGDIEL